MRIFWIVLDSAGIGDAPDAALFGDEGSNTIKRCYDSGKLKVPNMKRLGLFNIDRMTYGEPVQNPEGGYARLKEESMGKDTTTGHWEMAGMISKQPFPTYPEGFPEEIIEEFEEKTRRKVLCNLPYSGTYPEYVRTERRHDFSLEPKEETILDAAKKAGKDVIGVGKISDIFAGKGITRTTPNHGNRKNMEKVFEIAREEFDGICYINLVDFDMLYGHRRDIAGYTNALNEFDEQLGTLLDIMKPDDNLFITADHGCDPGYKGTDHTRECVPLLYYGSEKCMKRNLGIRESYADIAATIAEMLNIEYHGEGKCMIENHNFVK